MDKQTAMPTPISGIEVTAQEVMSRIQDVLSRVRRVSNELNEYADRLYGAVPSEGLDSNVEETPNELTQQLMQKCMHLEGVASRLEGAVTRVTQ